LAKVSRRSGRTGADVVDAATGTIAAATGARATESVFDEALSRAAGEGGAAEMAAIMAGRNGVMGIVLEASSRDRRGLRSNLEPREGAGAEVRGMERIGPTDMIDRAI
jgi:hypothetical protein